MFVGTLAGRGRAAAVALVRTFSPDRSRRRRGHCSRAEEEEVVNARRPSAATAPSAVVFVRVSRGSSACVSFNENSGGCRVKQALIEVQFFEVVLGLLLLAVEVLADDRFWEDETRVRLILVFK